MIMIMIMITQICNQCLISSIFLFLFFSNKRKKILRYLIASTVPYGILMILWNRMISLLKIVPYRTVLCIWCYILFIPEASEERWSKKIQTLCWDHNNLRYLKKKKYNAVVTIRTYISALGKFSTKVNTYNIFSNFKMCRNVFVIL